MFLTFFHFPSFFFHLFSVCSFYNLFQFTAFIQSVSNRFPLLFPNLNLRNLLHNQTFNYFLFGFKPIKLLFFFLRIPLPPPRVLQAKIGKESKKFSRTIFPPIFERFSDLSPLDKSQQTLILFFSMEQLRGNPPFPVVLPSSIE